MRRFIVTGAPGAGKTAIIRQLELDGFSVVEEAATDIIAAAQARGIAEPWTDPSFIDLITNLLRQRQIRASYQPDEIQFHGRWWSAPLPWLFISDTPSQVRLRVSYSASRAKRSLKAAFS